MPQNIIEARTDITKVMKHLTHDNDEKEQAKLDNFGKNKMAD